MKVVRLTAGGYALEGDDVGFVNAANAFLNSLLLRGLSPLTARAYAWDLVALHLWLVNTDGGVRDLQNSQLLGFISAQRKGGAAPTTINRRLSTCRVFYRFCTGRELPHNGTEPGAYYRGRGRDRALGLHVLERRRPGLRVKVPNRVVEPLTVEQVRRFLNSLRRYRDLAILHLMLLCGLRSQEVLTLRVADVEWSDRRLRVRGKGDRERVLPLPDILEQIVIDYLRLERPRGCPHPRLFVVLQGPRWAQPMTPAGLRSLFRHRRLDPALFNANAHRFRHTFGADMAREGVRLPVLQRLMGHADSSTTLRYIHLSMADISAEFRRAVEAIGQRYEP